MTSAQWQFTIDGQRVIAELQAQADDAAELMGEHVRQVANELVPIEEDTLRASGTVSDPDDGMVAVYYDTPYAVVQHEDLTLQHDPGRTAKYLERAWAGETAALRRIAADEMRL